MGGEATLRIDAGGWKCFYFCWVSGLGLDFKGIAVCKFGAWCSCLR